MKKAFCDLCGASIITAETVTMKIDIDFVNIVEESPHQQGYSFKAEFYDCHPECAMHLRKKMIDTMKGEIINTPEVQGSIDALHLLTNLSG